MSEDRYQIGRYQRYLIYFSMAGLLYLIFLFIAVLNPRPNLSYPDARPQFEPPEFYIDINFSGLEYIQIIFYIITAVIVFILVYQLMKFGSDIIGKRKRMVKDEKVISEKEAEKRLKDARTRAYVILNNCLISKDFTGGYIEAYQILDEDLDFFRDIARPKYYTPKEYAFSVKKPVFKPAVYQFVKMYTIMTLM